MQTDQIGVVGLPVIVAQHAKEKRNDSDLVRGIGATLFIWELVCIRENRSTMEPITRAVVIDGRFICLHQC